ncbi:unnamed protein product [Adineta steineri]|uniref:Uncharacterized protein n=1 Tax=Adineta steineri TaxID=433720 RepID=A0A819DEK2_9BILA|nr:unnamed protein product [Adineta steineri]
MNLNTRFFTTYNHRQRQPIIGYRSPLYHPHAPILKNRRSSYERLNASESFLPAITTMNSSDDGHNPYYRNDFANNHLFITKHKLARIFRNQLPMNIQSNNDDLYLVDRNEFEKKNSRLNKIKREENNFYPKINLPTDHDAHVPVINLILKPSVPSSYIRHSAQSISKHPTRTIKFRTKSLPSLMVWTNPTMDERIQSISNHIVGDDLEGNTTINELVDNNPFNTSLLYFKSIIPSKHA